ASRIDGSELRYNVADPLLPDILVCRPELSGMLLASIRDGADSGSAGPHAGGWRRSTPPPSAVSGLLRRIHGSGESAGVRALPAVPAGRPRGRGNLHHA